MKNILIIIEHITFFIFTILMVDITTAIDTFPQILTETHNQTFNLSSTAILTCHLRDLGEHHVTWFRIDLSTSISSPLAVGNRLFTTNKRYSISSYSTSARDSFWSLEIYQLNLSDEGIYSCKIATRRASVSVYINLHIQIPMIIYPAYAYTEPGTDIKLNCTVLIDENDPNKSAITWHFQSNQTNKSKTQDVHIRKKVFDNGLSSFLMINYAQISHTGIWTCVYRRQRLSAEVFVRKGIFNYQRTSALLANHSNARNFSINLFLFVLSMLKSRY